MESDHAGFALLLHVIFDRFNRGDTILSVGLLRIEPAKPTGISLCSHLRRIARRRESRRRESQCRLRGDPNGQKRSAPK